MSPPPRPEVNELRQAARRSAAPLYRADGCQKTAGPAVIARLAVVEFVVIRKSLFFGRPAARATAARGARCRRFGASRRLSQAGGRVDTLDGAAGPAGEGCPGAAASGIFHTTVLKLQMMDGRIFQLNCSDGGVPKLAVREA